MWLAHTALHNGRRFPDTVGSDACGIESPKANLEVPCNPSNSREELGFVHTHVGSESLRTALPATQGRPFSWNESRPLIHGVTNNKQQIPKTSPKVRPKQPALIIWGSPAASASDIVPSTDSERAFPQEPSQPNNNHSLRPKLSRLRYNPFGTFEMII